MYHGHHSKLPDRLAEPTPPPPLLDLTDKNSSAYVLEQVAHKNYFILCDSILALSRQCQQQSFFVL